MYGYIYLTTNLINNKKYIGQHRAETFDPNYHGSGTLIKKALKKYGTDSFSTTILEECYNMSELDEKEMYYIGLYNAVEDDNFYNTAYGGYRCGNKSLVYVYNEKEDILKLIPKDNADVYIEKGYRYGMRKRSSSQIENYKQSWQHSRGNILVTNDVETRYVHESDLPYYLSNGYRRGRIPTRPHQKDERRKWVNDGTKSLMVGEEEIPKYLEDGFSLGRVKFKSFNRKIPPHNLGKSLLMKDGVRKYVDKQYVDDYLLDGWSKVKNTK